MYNIIIETNDGGARVMNEEEKRTYKWFREIVHEVGSNNNSDILEYIMLLPDLFYLLCKLMMDKDVPRKSKRIVAIAVAYMVSPINLVPNLIPGLGLLDDVAVCIYALNKIIANTDIEVLNRHWYGTGKLLNTINDFISKADDLIGSGLLKKIKSMFL